MFNQNSKYNFSQHFQNLKSNKQWMIFNEHCCFCHTQKYSVEMNQQYLNQSQILNIFVLF